MNPTLKKLCLVPLLVAAGCASVPNGPSIQALPGTGKTWDQFRADDVDCRSYAAYQNQSPSDAQADSVARSAALGTVIGAVAGAALGGSRGAATGAGVGLLFGAAAGANEGNQAAYGTQRRYDQSYGQCMYAKGDKVEVRGGRMVQANPPPPPPSYAPPPPPNYPPPPPPGNYPQYPPPPTH